jgi:uncharacterized membrane protein
MTRVEEESFVKIVLGAGAAQPAPPDSATLHLRVLGEMRPRVPLYRAVENDLVIAAEVAYAVARREVYDVTDGIVDPALTPRQIAVLTALYAAEHDLRHHRQHHRSNPRPES